jgi:hypothetical protein
MNAVIIYRSLFGITKRYAELLREEIESDIYKYNQIDDYSLLRHDPVILCAGTYAGWISLTGFMKKNWHILQGRGVILLVIGVAPADASWSVRSYEKIPDVIREGIKYYKLPPKIGSRQADKARKECLAQVVEYINSIASQKEIRSRRGK